MSSSERAVSAEWECFKRARAGDERAWRVLVTKYRARLSALALFITGSGSAADDVVQETFVRALEAAIHNTAGSLHGFLGTITYRLAVKEAARIRRNVRLDTLEPEAPGEDALHQVLNEERDRLVAEAINSLRTEQRDVLLLRCYGGHSYEQIAELLAVPLGTVKSRLFYAVKSCRERLRRKGVLD